MGLKTLIGKGHEEFSTMKQQDSEEFLTYLLTVLRRDAHKFKDRSEQGVCLAFLFHASYVAHSPSDATAVFSYAMEQRLQCADCKKVRYRTDAMDVVSVAVPVKEKGSDDNGKVIYEDVSLGECLDGLFKTEALEYACPSCKKPVHALK